MSRRVIEREYVDDAPDTVVVDDRPFFFSPLAIVAGVIAIVLLLWLLIATPFWDSSPSPAPTQEAPAREAPATDSDAGEGSGVEGGGGANTGNAGNTDSGSEGGVESP